MTSQALYRKWRSQSFDEFVGQEAVVRTLKNALSSGKLAHAYLFTGPRGTGKTTTARLLAKAINCEHPRDGEPCNECQSCREITAGTSFDVIEIDAASNRGIDSIRDLREKVQMRPSSGKYKVYVLDEAHMLTTEAFNALLKTLEEPPDYAVFVLATTDVHKMLPTVLSRCQRFDFKRFTLRQLVDHLNYVAKQEHVTLEKGAAELIARAAAGGMRDALSLLDQAISYAGETITLAQVQAMLGVADPRAVQKLILHVAEGDSAGGLHLIHELAEAGADLRQVNAQVIEYWRGLMLARAGANVSEILDSTDDEVQEIREIAQRFELEELTECARICAQNELVQKSQGTPQLALELAFLECVEIHRRAQSGQPVTREPARLTVVPGRSAESAPRPVEPPPARPASPAPAPRYDAPVRDRPPAYESVPVTPVQPDPEKAHKESAPPSAPDTVANQPGLTLQQVKSAWETVVRRVEVKSRQVGAYLKFFHVIDVESGDVPTVVLQATKDVYYNSMSTGNRHRPVEAALRLEFDCECRVRLVRPGQQSPTSLPPAGSVADAFSMIAPGRRGRSPVKPPAPPQEPEPELPPPPEEPEDYISFEPPTFEGPARMSTDPLARTGNVRENTSNAAPRGNGKSAEAGSNGHAASRRTLPPEMLEQKARNDPRVQAAIKTFKAKIDDINPK